MLKEVRTAILKSQMPSREDLMSISLSSLRNLDIRTPEQAELIQGVFSERMNNLPPEVKVNISDIIRQMDKEINRMTPEKEAEYQKIIDERLAESKTGLVTTEDEIETLTKELDYLIGDIEKETIVDIKHTPTEEEIKSNNLEDVVNKGDVITIPNENLESKCQFCGTKGMRHFKTCTRPK